MLLFILYLTSRASQVKTVEVERVVTKEVVRVEWRDRIVNKNVEVVKTITKPDGTVIVVDKKDKSTVADKSGSTTQEKVVESEKRKEVIAPPSLPRYSLSASVPLLPFHYDKPSEYLVGVGVRFGNLPLWLQLDSRPLQKEVYLGVRLEL